MLSCNVIVPSANGEESSKTSSPYIPYHPSTSGLAWCLANPQSRNSFDNGTVALLYAYRTRTSPSEAALRFGTTTVLHVAH
jgi:hypothetical protein